MMCDKDYSLLRPFDLEAAKRGEPTCWYDGTVASFVAASDAANEFHCFRIDEEGRLRMASGSDVRMAPLAWVEGRPVYAGDVLYNRLNSIRFVASSGGALSPNGIPLRWDSADADVLTWTLFNVRREGWINLYPHRSGATYNVYASFVHKSKEEADKAAVVAEGCRIACVYIEWEPTGGAA